LSIIVPCN